MNDQVSLKLAPDMVHTNLIGGRNLPASDGMTMDVLSPADGALRSAAAFS